MQFLILNVFEKELHPLIEDVLKILDEYNIERCVASNSTRSQVLQCLKVTNQLRFFLDKDIFTSQQVSRGKPAPDLFLFAAKQMNYLPENCIVVEDSLPGIQAALFAGMRVIGFLGGSHAQYDWYRQKLEAYDILIARDSEQLLLILLDVLMQVLQVFQHLLVHQPKRLDKDVS